MVSSAELKGRSPILASDVMVIPNEPTDDSAVEYPPGLRLLLLVLALVLSIFLVALTWSVCSQPSTSGEVRLIDCRRL